MTPLPAATSREQMIREWADESKGLSGNSYADMGAEFGWLMVRDLLALLDEARQERDSARAGLFHRITRWDVDGQQETKAQDELQILRDDNERLRNTVAMLTSSDELAAVVQGMKDITAGRVVCPPECSHKAERDALDGQVTALKDEKFVIANSELHLAERVRFLESQVTALAQERDKYREMAVRVVTAEQERTNAVNYVNERTHELCGQIDQLRAQLAAAEGKVERLKSQLAQKPFGGAGGRRGDDKMRVLITRQGDDLFGQTVTAHWRNSNCVSVGCADGIRYYFASSRDFVEVK